MGGEYPAFTSSPTQEKPKEAPIPFAPNTVALELSPGKADLIESTDRSVSRRDAVTGKPVWDASRPVKPLDRNRDPVDWITKLSGYHGLGLPLEPVARSRSRWYGRPGLGIAAVSVDSRTLGQGRFDAVVLFRPTRWARRARARRPLHPPTRQFARAGETWGRWGRVVGTPAVFDADRDSTPDVIATVVFSESDEEQARRRAEATRRGEAPDQNTLQRRTIEAVSGHLGRRLWSYVVDSAFAAYTYSTWDRPATLVRGRQTALIAYVDGERVIVLDPTTGRPKAGPFELGLVPVRPIQHVDLDGDGEPEILALGPGGLSSQQTLVALSIMTGRQLWVETINGRYEQMNQLALPADWPLLLDLDGDGRVEIAVPDAGQFSPRNGYRGLRLFDGATGKARWTRPMRPETKAQDGLVHLIDAPISMATARAISSPSRSSTGGRARSTGATLAEPARIYVDALSGKDGRPLWWWRVDLPRNLYFRIWVPRWWGRGADGWPLLAVGLGGRLYGGMEGAVPRSSLHPPIVHVLESSTGREAHTIAGLTQPRAADLDGDGLADLWGEFDGELRAFRGEIPEIWRSLGWLDKAGDLDGDGVTDTVTPYLRAADTQPAGETIGSRTALVRSGRDGRVLWKSQLDFASGSDVTDRGEHVWLTPFASADGDVDGDGIPDILVERRPRGPQSSQKGTALPIQLLSGRDGSPLWWAAPMPSGFVGFGDARIQRKYVRVIEPHGTPDVLVHYGGRFVKPGSAPLPKSGLWEPRMARLSGRDGRIIWDIALLQQPTGDSWQNPPNPDFGDLDGDGALDVVMELPSGFAFQVLAVSLRDGKLLWSRRSDSRITTRHCKVPCSLWPTSTGTAVPRSSSLSVPKVTSCWRRSMAAMGQSSGPGVARWIRRSLVRCFSRRLASRTSTATGSKRSAYASVKTRERGKSQSSTHRASSAGAGLSRGMGARS